SGSSGDTRSPVTNAKAAAYTPVVAGVYWVRVTDECGKEHKDSTTLSVSTGTCTPAVITLQPQSVDIAWGDRPTLHVEANNATSYRWYEVGNTTPAGWSKDFTPQVPPILTTS